MSWERLCTHGDSEAEVRDVLLTEFDLRWADIARDIRRQLIEQGCSTSEAFAAAEQCRHVFRADAAAQAPRVLDNMASTAAPRH